VFSYKDNYLIEMTGLWAEWWRVSLWYRHKIFCFSTVFRPSVGPSLSCVQLSAGGSSSWVEQVGHEVDLPRLRISGTIPSLPLYAYKAHKDNFMFYL
jgi:hypothetical protein